MNIDGWQCDVFSWGIILWEMLTRRLPFEGEASLALSRTVLHCTAQCAIYIHISSMYILNKENVWRSLLIGSNG